MTSTDGRQLTVVDPGWINTAAGPDFFNAKVIIDGNEWAGNIEVHLRASDWYRHGHHNDPAYNSVILHVVENDDMEIRTQNGRTPTQVVFRCDDRVKALYNYLLTARELDLVCSGTIPSLTPLDLNGWIDTLAYERVYMKADRFRSYLDATGHDYEQAMFTAIARAMGFGRNSETLERVALSIPLRLLAKHSDSPLALEAMVLGQAALIPADGGNGYVEQLRREYNYLAIKFNLVPPAGVTWNMGRMRPQNLPFRRLATLAQMALGGFQIFAAVISAQSLRDLRDLFRIDLTGYWATASSLTSERGCTPAAMSERAIDSIIINAAVPAMVAYGMERDNSDTVERAMELLRQLPPEDNSKVRLLTSAGIPCPDAYTSQALTMLRNVYCEQRKCLFCRIGHRMISTTKR